MVREIVPLTLHDADEFIRAWHRDHKYHPISRFHRFSIGLTADEKLIGAVIVGFPMARHTDRHQVAEVNRLATGGSKNACSQLLGNASQAVKAMGFARLVMFVEPTERTAPSFLKAAGFRFDGETSGARWDRGRTTDSRIRRPSPDNSKHRWVIDYKIVASVTPVRRKCNECGAPIPLLSRPERKTCSDSCRMRMSRRLRAASGFRV